VTFPYLIPPYIKAKRDLDAAAKTAGSSTNAAAFSMSEQPPQQQQHRAALGWGATVNLTCLATRDSHVSKILEQTKRLAGCADYKDRTILNTGANNHICNNYNCFVS
jgi:hypothetical protein